jgi:predicted transcriptional regulator of viral defense system
MITRNTILAQSDRVVLEDIIVKKGRIVLFGDLRAAYSNRYGYQALKNRLSKLVQAGWLVRLKRGQYLIITDFTTLGVNDIHQYVIAQAFNEDSYISLESALQYHSMFDQMLIRLDGITKGVARSYKLQGSTYKFSHIKDNLYFGFTEERIDRSYSVQIAEAEKALLDMLYFRTSGYSTSLVLEKLHDYRQQLDFVKLQAYAQRYGVGMVRKVGFILDYLGVDTTELYTKTEVKQNSFSKFAATDRTFNAKWRIYYDSTLFN